MPMITSGSPNGPKNEQQAAGPNQRPHCISSWAFVGSRAGIAILLVAVVLFKLRFVRASRSSAPRYGDR
jgi:hypothetical protein